MTRHDTPDLVPGDFFVLRTPLLPFEELARWTGDLEAPRTTGEDLDRLAAAVAADRERLRRGLDELLARPELEEALRVASPALLEGLPAWRRDPESKKGKRFEEALVRYLERMCTRSTPFGLFSGCTVGSVGTETALALADRASYRRHTRLDSGYLCQLCHELDRAPELRRNLRYRVSSSLYPIGDRIRYTEVHLRDGSRSHRLVVLDRDAYLDRALDLAAGGATVDELADALVDVDPEAGVTLEEAREYVEELVEAQVLVSDLAPPVTGEAAIDDLVGQLRGRTEAEPAAAALASARDRLAELDRRPVGSDLEAYGSVASVLEALPARVEPSRLLQVDLTKPGTAVLGPGVLADVERGARVLHRVAGGSRNRELERFRQAFLDRYETGEEVPLVEVLDDELGPGLGAGGGSGGDPAPLLDGLALPKAEGEEPAYPASRRPITELLLRKIEGALGDGAPEIELTEEDLEPLPPPGLPLPDAFLAKCTLAGGAGADEPQVVLDFVSGPSGAQMLGRFCYADPELEESVRRHLRREESLDPEAVFAEIVHLPEGRMGNILLRPVLRDYEIPFLGRSGAPEGRQIPVTDLLVSVTDDQIVLRSRRLGRRVAPRLTSAHNFRSRSLATYRFLCMVQSQGAAPGIRWDWHPLEALSFLPRVRSGRVVLSRARWRVPRTEIEGLYHADPARRLAAAREWREVRRLPRRALLGDADNELYVDFENSLSLDAFAAAVKRRPAFELVELYPAPEETCVSGPEGGFCHELLVPFTRRTSPRARAAVAPVTAPVRRSFAPGSEWLYAKLYTGTATADRVLTDLVWPLTREALAAETIDGWFFLRYADPHPHLRLRFHGAPEVLHRQVLPALERAVAPLLANGLAWRLQLQDYRREVERYGGAAGIELAERLFHLDSEAVVELLRALPDDDAADARWRLALLGTDLLISDLGFDAERRSALVSEMKRGWAEEFRLDGSTALKKQLSDRLRTEMDALRALVFGPVAGDHPLAPGVAALRRRSERTRPVVAELRARERSGALSTPLAAIALSLVHMFNNRLFRSQGRAHEMVLSDFLERLYLSEAARSRARNGEPRRGRREGAA